MIHDTYIPKRFFLRILSTPLTLIIIYIWKSQTPKQNNQKKIGEEVFIVVGRERPKERLPDLGT